MSYGYISENVASRESVRRTMLNGAFSSEDKLPLTKFNQKVWCDALPRSLRDAPMSYPPVKTGSLED